MKCARCGRVIKSNVFSKIGNYFYGSTCARKMNLTKKNVKVKNEASKSDDSQYNLF